MRHGLFYWTVFACAVPFYGLGWLAGVIRAAWREGVDDGTYYGRHGE